MKKIYILIIISILANIKISNAQAIKLDYLAFSGIASRYSKPFFWGIGYDHNLGDKISIGLTYKSGYALDADYFNTEISYGFPAVDASNIEHLVTFNVVHNTSWREFAYTSKYFFADNTDGGYFVSSGISLFQAKNEYQVSGLAVDMDPKTNYLDIAEGIYEQNITLLPISFDLGGRGAFDGFYFEYYLGMGFLPFGSQKDVKPAFLFNHGVETRFQPISFHLGLCVGVSWAD